MDDSRTQRVLSGMRPTGPLHLGHYHGVLKNWLTLQHRYECFFFVADWHALTTEYEQPGEIARWSFEMVVDWLAVGVSPSQACLFVQSRVPEHAELHLLLSMITPLGWLERVPSYKDQQAQLKEKDLATYGFLGYPLLQAADILIYRASWVPVGEDQVAHVELTREVARRFNHLYGAEPDFAARAEKAIDRLGPKNAELYRRLRRRYREQGDAEALEVARALLAGQTALSVADRERLLGYLEGDSRAILPEPAPLLAPQSKMVGLDGRKMSKSYGNTIGLREGPEQVEKKLRTMPTDPARVRRSDPGNPENCPVWSLHQVYSDEARRAWVWEGCTQAGIGCVDCKRPLIEAVQAELEPIRERAQALAADPAAVEAVIDRGCERAREIAADTLDTVRRVMGLRGAAAVSETPEGPARPAQQEMPFALVQGKPLTVLPTDLYIPPDALEVILEAFEGPLDLLLYLIKRQNLDILDIPIADITRQYMDYIAMMKVLKLELAAEYLVMAAMLAEIKSRMLLPRPVAEDGEEDDPRAELVRRLQEYERFKDAAERLDALPRVERDVFPAAAEPPPAARTRPLPDVKLKELLLAFREVLLRAELLAHHHVQREALSVRERMSDILDRVRGAAFVAFTALFAPDEGRLGVVVTFLAVLELVKEGLVDVVQTEPFAPIHLKAAAAAEET
ncbi:MAG: hypothetical protein KatS3mg121_0408 [Gammaproteobacteria bacterium]|nr:MAG: hypothetical protein KatS3mg121_0408 [Gammaproteobacteria bacterium]